MARRFPKAVLAALMLFASATGTQAAPDGQTSFTLSIGGWVPVVCRATLGQAAVDIERGEIDLGDMQEFCNDGHGYQVWVDCPPDMPAAMLYVDGEEIALSPTGSTMISASSTAARRSRHVTLALADDSQAALPYLSIRVVAL